MAEGAERFRGLWEDEMFARQRYSTEVRVDWRERPRVSK